MEWFDMMCGTDDAEPGGILELPEFASAPGLALELHVLVRRQGTLAVWLLADGTVIGEAAVANA